MSIYEAYQVLKRGGRVEWVGKEGLKTEEVILRKKCLYWFVNETAVPTKDLFLDGYQEIHGPHDWAWVCARLLEGKSIRRRDWDHDYYWRFDDEEYLVSGLGKYPPVEKEDFEATDWVLYTEE